MSPRLEVGAMVGDVPCLLVMVDLSSKSQGLTVTWCSLFQQKLIKRNPKKCCNIGNYKNSGKRENNKS